MVEQDVETLSLEGLFTNEEYNVRSFRFGDKELQIKCLQAASNAPLQALKCSIQEGASVQKLQYCSMIVWPAAMLLATFLACNTAIMTDSYAACELGSGLGLAGLLCGQYCNTVLTDHNKIVLRVLQENAHSNACQHQVRCQLADWESMKDVMALKDLSPKSEGYDLIIGADICYSIKALPFIFRCLKILLADSKGSRGYLGYVSRAAGIDRGIHAESEKAGLELREVEGTRQSVGAGLEGAIYLFRHRD